VAIPDEDVARVRAATDIVGLIGERVSLKRQGRRFVGLCPFHEERTPSFSVNAEDGLYYCFGCHRSGDAITFVRETEHLDFPEAVLRLAERAGITIREERSAKSQRLRPLYEALARAVDFYHERLLHAPDAEEARRYLLGRGIDEQAWARFSLGWAPGEFDALARALRVPEGVFVGAGLGYPNRRGLLQDGLRSRVVFPIFDPSGRPIALAGRILPGGEGPKYRNTPETVLYQKRKVLYGLNWAKEAIARNGEVVVCEGYTDVLACHLAGIEQAVATCGTALAEEHLALLAGFARRVILAYDADAAGATGVARVAAWEREHELDVVVAEFPEGEDPASVEPEALRKTLAEAMPFLRFLLERHFRSVALDTPEARARAARTAVEIVSRHPDRMVREQYLLSVAERCRIDPALLRPRRVAAPRHAAPRTQDPPVAKPELEALRLAVQRPELVACDLEPFLFEDPGVAAAIRLLLVSSELHEAIARAEPEVAGLLRRAAVEDPPSDPEDVIANLVRRAARRELRRAALEAKASPDLASALAPETQRAQQLMELLDDAAHRREAVEGLLAWLRGRAEEGR
jgi:DNA primase